MTRQVPLYRSLVVRLLAASLVVAVAAIVATAWLATQTTTRAIQQEQGRSLAEDKSIYDALVGYAATHRAWAGVEAVIAGQGTELGRRITLMTEDREIIAESAPGPSLRLARASATVDPLRLDLRLSGGTDRIDPRVAGPFRLTGQERKNLRAVLGGQLKCMRAGLVDGKIVDAADGRPTVERVGLDPKGMTEFCRDQLGDKATTTPTEKRALRGLGRLVGRCLDLPNPDAVQISRDFTVSPFVPGLVDDRLFGAKAGSRVNSCVLESRQTQLRPYVAPAALLFVTDPGSTADEPVFSLSRANLFRIIWVTGAVLLAAVLVTVLVGRRLVRPLRALAEAAAGPVDRRARMPDSGRDEIGHLARALNDLAERRERAEQQRRAMVGDVAHELRTPLTNIRSWVEAAQDGLTPTGPQLLDLLHEEAVQLQHIIDDLADLAAADAGNLRMHPEPVAVRDILYQVADAHRSAAHTAGITLTVAVADDPELDADPVRLRQLIGNLVANAVRYTPPGGKVTLEAATGAEELTVTVHDTGIGIAAEDLPRIFDRFWRADSSRTRATGGSGLGLPIARKLAEAHGGSITARSSAGTGTTMAIRLPLTRPPVPAAH
jgi:two-component system sensor histidine kinase BaeS